MNPVYLDYAATTPVDERVLQAMKPYFCERFGNASSLYSWGREARKAVAEAREKVAALLQASPSEVYFTSGGSESDNWAIKGAAFALRRAGRGKHIITSCVEHHAVLNACRWLEQEGFEVTYLPVDKNGRVLPEQVFDALRDDTVLVSIMTANNEVGTIEPIAEIGRRMQEQQIFFHTDAVQAAGHIPIAVDELHVDALSLSGHKLYGPKGVGALYLRRGSSLDSLVHGGPQEREMRAGTENTAGIVGLGQAAELAKQEMSDEWERLSDLRDMLIAAVRELGDSWINGDEKYRLPGHVSFGLRGISQDTLLIRLDMAGFAVSAGSACSAGALEPSHVLLAMGQTKEQASSAIRVTLGRFTSVEEVQRFIRKLSLLVGAIRGR
ncbi:cysteine desulfurase family protein [Selenomonas montiformis]|uniref:cysteine desulfurase n=1 Tax=Selenomonas montiformis TaxID=2652285 RepID=A0A6I2V0I8_9FIRM|nr:cysteine desulfurase family protein [Selenomonas montiformis]MSV25431.1 cysteine desulfurase [Selenomonas montiformis]